MILPRLWHTIFTFPIFLVLGACVTLGPDYTLPKEALVNAPLARGTIAGSEGAAVTQEELPNDWWRLYDDPLLNQVVQDALRSNTTLRVAAANLLRSRAAVDFSKAQGGLSGNANATFQRAQESAEQFLATSKLPVANIGDIGINISYELDLFGKLRRGVEAARADDEAAIAAADLARITVVGDVVGAYVEACSAGNELAVANESLRLETQRVMLTKQLRDVGRGSQVDVTRRQTQVDLLTADIPRFEARRHAAQFQLAMLLARAPTELPADIRTCDKPPRLRQAIPVGDGAAMLRRRPDVRESERQLAAATARVGVSIAQMYPSVSIGAGAGSLGSLDDLFSSTTNNWSFGPLIRWTFPVNGQRARVQEAKATAAGALAHFDGVVLNALRETQSRLATYAADEQRADALSKAFASASNSAEETHHLYAAGRESFLADLDATSVLTNARAQLAAAEAQLARDQVALFLALGGGWQHPVENVTQRNNDK